MGVTGLLTGLVACVFPVVDAQTVSLSVARFHWADGREVVEEVCETSAPLVVPTLDIRGREGEWFDCEPPEPAPSLECHSDSGAVVLVRPAVVIRGWAEPGGAVRDTHFHAYVYPGGDPARERDLFARSLSRALGGGPITLDAAGGGRGERSGEDSYYVRADFSPLPF